MGQRMTNLVAKPAAILVIALLTACRTTPAESDWQLYSYTQPEMGVDFAIQFYAPDNATARHAAKAVFDRVEALNAIFSDYDPDSELSRLTRKPVGKPIQVSPELFAVLRRAQKLARETSGAFDITAGPYTQLWRVARRQKKLTTPIVLKAVARSVGHQKLRLDPHNRTVTCLSPDMRLDLGGIAKGLATDEALAILRRNNLTRARCAASGDIVLGEPPPGEDGWAVGIPAIDQQGNLYRRTLRLRNCAVSTSGDTFQFVEINGQRYSHIVDPRTGLGLTNRIMVTVIAPTGMETDCQATAISVMGIKPGIRHADRNKLATIITPMDGSLKSPWMSAEWRSGFD